MSFIVENMTDGIHIIENSKMVYKSPKYLEMIGMSAEEKDKYYNIDSFHLVHEEDRELFRATVHAAISKKLESVRFVYRCLNGKGKYIWRDDVMNIQYDNNSQAYRAVTITRDVTEAKNKEIELVTKGKIASFQNKLLLKLFAQTYSYSLEKSLQKLTEFATEGLQVDRASYWYFTNDGLICRNLFDTATNEHIGGLAILKTDMNIYLNAIHNNTELIINDVLTHHATSEFITSYLIPEGIKKLLDLPVRENGKIVGILCFESRKNDVLWSDNDITFARSLADFLSIKFAEEKQNNVEKKLFENEKQLTLITENTTDGIYVIENSCITYMSPACKQLLKHTRDDGEVFTIDDMFNNIHPDDHHNIKKYIYNSLSEKKEAFKYELRIKDAENNYHWREDSINVIYGANGQYSKYIVITRDISERKKSENEKKQLYEITEKQNDRLINFTHIVSHDIRSHTSNMSMILDLCEENENEVERREYFAMLKESTDKLSETIFYLNETVAIQNGLEKEKVNINLKKAVEKSVLGISAVIKTNKAEIDIAIDDNLEVLATSSYLESILFNLITNAIKYQSSNRKPKITILATRNDNYIQIDIADNGQGIDLDKYGDKIFGMYKTFHGNSDAVGLGLFMVKNQIEAMGGKIAVESQLDIGTTFKLHLVWKK